CGTPSRNWPTQPRSTQLRAAASVHPSSHQRAGCVPRRQKEETTHATTAKPAGGTTAHGFSSGCSALFSDDDIRGTCQFIFAECAQLGANRRGQPVFSFTKGAIVIHHVESLLERGQKLIATPFVERHMKAQTSAAQMIPCIDALRQRPKRDFRQ